MSYPPPEFAEPAPADPETQVRCPQAVSPHKTVIQDSSYVKRYGICLLPELYAHLNPMPYEAAVQMERDLAEDLRRAGYTVTGGH